MTKNDLALVFYGVLTSSIKKIEHGDKDVTVYDLLTFLNNELYELGTINDYQLERFRNIIRDKQYSIIREKEELTK